MKKQFYLLYVISFLFSVMLPAQADGMMDRLSRVKAAFILNIARYVEWPDTHKNSEDKEFQLCFYRKNPLGPAIKSIHNKRIGSKRLRTHIMDSLDQLNGCNLLFLTQTQMAEIADQIAGMTDAQVADQYALLFNENILTMGDLSNQVDRKVKIEGVTICLIRESTRIGIEINMSSLNNSNLKISSELLKLSKRN